MTLTFPGSATTDWRRNGERGGLVRLDSDSLGTHVYVAPHLIAATDAARTAPVGGRGGEPVDRPRSGFTPATKNPTQGSAADPLHAEGDEAPFQPGRHLHNPATQSLDGPVGHDHGSVYGEATPASEGGGAGARSIAARSTDPATSHLAAASITEQARRDIHRTVLAILAEGPASDFDLAARTGLKQTSVGKRRGELRDMGYVTELDHQGVSDTGSSCVRWTLTSAGWAAA